MEFGERLRALRKARRWTQVQLAQQSGVSQTVISNVETGDIKSTGVENVARLAAALGVPIEELTGTPATEPLPAPVVAELLERMDRLSPVKQNLVLGLLRELDAPVPPRPPGSEEVPPQTPPESGT